MDISVKPGRYVIAVSGGVDSVVLLDLAQARPDVRLTVAHFDHGIRNDSQQDRQFVAELAKTYNMPFVYDEGALGKDASEATARAARYAFLEKVCASVGAQAIITAHHQDDVIETVLINLLRGTNRKGLSSLQSTAKIVRPLLAVPKQQLVEYAKEHKLAWREDSTNEDMAYTRNAIRHQLIPKLTDQQRAQLVSMAQNMHVTNREIDAILSDIIAARTTSDKLEKRLVTMATHAVSKELIAHWLRGNGVRTFNAKMLERIVTATKTYRPDQVVDVDKNYYIAIQSDCLALRRRDR